MKTINFLILIFLSTILCAQIPFAPLPSFETNPSNHVATGLGIADINNDGWKDIIVANGNDIYRQHLVVYYNNGDGTFPMDPSWQSGDIDYHGHLSAGDVDNDGDVDIAVSVYLGAGGFSTPGKVKVYYNLGEELESIPSFESESFYSFSCALGDADGDGDLDIAAACGEPYNSIYEYGRVFINNNGNFSTNAEWLSDNLMGAMDVEFGDVDQNGYLDLIFVCENMNNYVFLADQSGVIDTEWDWSSDHPENFMNSVDFGRPCADVNPCIVSSGNDQLGGDGKIKQFVFNPPIPSSSPPDWESGYVGYGSGILLAEINNDDNLDLLYGSWWGPLTILEGDCGFWDPAPAYVADQSSVVEAILMSDLGKFNYGQDEKTIKPITEHSTLYLDHQIIEHIRDIFVNSQQLSHSDYCHVELKNWISFKNNLMPGDVVTVQYDYMKEGDIVISNWDSGKGNYIYYNQNNPVGIGEPKQLASESIIRRISYNPAISGINLELNPMDDNEYQLRIFDVAGRCHSILTLYGSGSHRIDVDSFNDGIFILEISTGKRLEQKKLMIHN